MASSCISLSEDGKKYQTQGGVGGMFPGLSQYFLRISGPSGFGGHSTSDQVVAKWDGTGKVAIVTGAAGGLGYETARALASRGAEVVVTARDQAKAQAAVESLQQKLPKEDGSRLVAMALDLSDQASIKAFAQAFLATKKPLHILINNAGVMAIPKYTTTKDGFESQLGVNHFGHWTLTQLLLPTIIDTAKSSGAEGRVVCVSSSAHHMAYSEGIRVQGHDDASKYTAWGAYGQSKLANALFARELAVRLKSKGAPVAVYTLHPGAIPTDLQRDMDSCSQVIFKKVTRPLLKSIPQGAATQLLAATAPAGWAPSGEFLIDCNVMASSALSHDASLGKALWELSEKATGVAGAV